MAGTKSQNHKQGQSAHSNYAHGLGATHAHYICIGCIYAWPTTGSAAATEPNFKIHTTSRLYNYVHTHIAMWAFSLSLALIIIEVHARVSDLLVSVI